MNEITLKQLRNTLERYHWVVLDELPGDGYKFSGFWKISRPDHSCPLTLAFNGLDDMETLPIEKSYGFELIEYPAVGAYMGKHTSKSWPKELKDFMNQLNKLKT